MAEARVDRWVPHPRDKVWRALANPAFASLWLPFDGYKAEVGHRFTARGRRGPEACEVLDVDAPNRVVFSWQIGNERSTVTLALVEESGGTRVFVLHMGLDDGRRASQLAMWTALLQDPLGEVIGSGAVTGATGRIGLGKLVAGVGGAVVVIGVAALGLSMRGPKAQQATPEPTVVRTRASVDPPVPDPNPEAEPAHAVEESPSALPEGATGELIVYERELPTTLNPLYPSTDVDRRTSELVFDGLFYRSTITGEVRSRVVERHERVGSDLRLTLRDDVRFHDGDLLTATDVCFSVAAVLNPENPTPLRFRERGELLGCIVEDPHVAVLRFASPFHAQPNRAAVPLLPSHRFASSAVPPDDAFAQQPVGTGPFHARRGRDTVDLTAHNSPHRTALLAGITIAAGGDPEVQARTLLSRGVVGMLTAPPSMLSEFRASDDVALKTYDTRSVLYVATNPATLPDLPVRAALDAAIDRQALCQLVTHTGPNEIIGVCDPVSGPWLRSSPLDNRSVPMPGGGPDEVHSAMTLAGGVKTRGRWYVGGARVQVRLGVDPAVEARLPGLRRALAKQLRSVGFTVQEASSSVPTPDQVDLWIGNHAYGMTEDAVPMLSPTVLGARSSRIDELLARMHGARTDTEWQDMARDLHVVVAEDKWVLPLWPEKAKSAWLNRVRDNTIAPGQFWTEVHSWRAP